MRVPSFAIALALAIATPSSIPARAGEPALSTAVLLVRAELDRVTAGTRADAALVVGEGPAPMVQPEPPRRLPDLIRWLRLRIGCSLPGRVCIQG